MMSPSDYEKRLIAMVDSFTKTVARNFSRNLKRAKANREKHFSDEPVDYLLETFKPRRQVSVRPFCALCGRAILRGSQRNFI